MLRILGVLAVFAGLIYGVGALPKALDLADPTFKDKYPVLLAEWTEEVRYDATLSIVAFGSSVLLFVLASMLMKLWQIEYHLRSELADRQSVAPPPEA